MNDSDKINAILKKILDDRQTDDDLGQLRKLVASHGDGEIVLTVSEGKNIVGKIIGDKIQIGDRTIQTSGGNYHQGNIINYGIDAEKIRDVLWEIFGDQKPAVIPPEKLPEAVCDFLADIEAHFKYIGLFHTPQKIILKEQYIPIQVTLERIYRHEVESIGYTESEDELKQAYALKHWEEKEKQKEAEEKEKEEIRKTQVDWQEAKAEHQRLVILADPGMGKSTLLKIEALSMAQQQQDQLYQQQITVDEAVLPLFVRLSELAKDKAEILDLMPQLMQRDYPRSFPGLEQFLRKKIKAGQYLLLLDALDEVPRDQRNPLIEKLRRFTRNYPGQIYGTSRIVGYGGTLLDDAKEVEIVPFNSQQTQDYIKTWFTNAQGYLEDESVSAEGLIQELQHKPQIKGLAQNPLLLSLLCSLYQEKKLELPARRGQVYAQAVKYMLGKWRSQREQQSEAKIRAKIRLLSVLAYEFTEKGQEIFDEDDLYDCIEDSLEDGKVPRDFRKADTCELIEELCEADGMIQKLNREADRYLFLHRTFQEYLTAVYLKQQIKKNPKKGMALVKAHFWEYDWHETLTLLAGLLDDPIPLLKAIKKEPDDIFHSLLLFAGRCLAECQPYNEPIFNQIMDEIYNIWRNDRNTFAYMESTMVAIGQSHRYIDRYLPSSKKNVPEVLKALSKINDLVQPGGLTAALQPSNSSESKNAKNALEELLSKINPSNPLPSLIAALDNSNKLVRYYAANILSKIDISKAISDLIPALQHSDGWVRHFVAEAFENISSSEAVPSLIVALQDSESSVRSIAARVLGKIGSPEAVPDLIAALQDSNEDENVRRYAAEALGNIGSPEAVAGLIAALQDSNSSVRRNAAEALGKIGDLDILESIVKSPKIDIFDRDIFLLARKLAIKFHKEKDRVDFIPVYQDMVN